MDPIILFVEHPVLIRGPDGLREQGSGLSDLIIAGLRTAFGEIELGTPLRFYCERGHLHNLPNDTTAVPRIISVLAQRSHWGEQAWFDLIKHRPEEVAEAPVFNELHRKAITEENVHGTRTEMRLLEGTSGSLYGKLLTLLRDEQATRGTNLEFLAEEPGALSWSYALSGSAWRSHAGQAFNNGMIEESLMAASLAERRIKAAADSRDDSVAAEISQDRPKFQVVGFRGASHRPALTAKLRRLGVELDARGLGDVPDERWRPRDVYRAEECPPVESARGRQLLLLDLIWMSYRNGRDIAVPATIYRAQPAELESWVGNIGRRVPQLGKQVTAQTESWVSSIPAD